MGHSLHYSKGSLWSSSQDNQFLSEIVTLYISCKQYNINSLLQFSGLYVPLKLVVLSEQLHEKNN